MNKTELENAIKNGESVWYIVNNELAEIDLSCNFHKIEDSELLTWYDKYSKDYYTHRKKLEDLYKTKAEAEHYLHHANVTRTEQLPFLTWEEFEERKSLYFTDKQGKEYVLTRDVRWSNDENRTEYCLRINNMTDFKIVKSYDYTEANFYKAYDECVRLFRSEG